MPWSIGERTTYSYDLAGRETLRRYPGGPRVTTAYDAMGNRIKMRDATGLSTMTFDALDRPNDVRNPANKRVTYAEAIGATQLKILETRVAVSQRA